MKKSFRKISLSALAVMLAAACTDVRDDQFLKPDKKTDVKSEGGQEADTVMITLDWTATQQRIDGFGAFAGREKPFFESPLRDSIIRRLWGPDGLQLNIVRSEIMHTYPYDATGNMTSIRPAGVSIDVDPRSPAYQALEDSRKKHLAQFWILKKIKERYPATAMFASCWSPPVDMKLRPVVHAQWGNGLKPEYAASFANYLTSFAKLHRQEDINFYAVSPTNEPDNVVAEWQASFWAHDDLGQFISNNLRPALNAQGLNSVKIIAAENASWLVSNGYFVGMDKSNVDILASHGYVDPLKLAQGMRGLDQDPGPWNQTWGKTLWMTEASDDGGGYDNTMRGGLRLAINMHEFLAKNNASAYIFWLGMLPYLNNEALICTKPDGSLDYPKMYDVMGQFSRYVSKGYYRFDATLEGSDSVRVSSYKDMATGKFSVVVINPRAKAATCRINLSGFSAARLVPFTTSDKSIRHWQQGPAQMPKNDGSFVITVPAASVTTFTGAGK
jgi:O-glycosyl hydrolase